MNWHRTSTSETPLLVFGEALRQARRARRRRRRSVFASGFLVIAVALTIPSPPSPRLVWNASSSAPVGLYLVTPGGRPLRGNMVIARLPSPWRSLAEARRYLPARVPLVKQVAAVNGDEICALGVRVFLNGEPLAERLEKDRKGRVLPWWEGCRRLRRGEYFLLMRDNPASFDGRYFGVTKADDIVGPAWLLWAR